MSKSKNRHRDAKQEAGDTWVRWQVLTSIIRIAIDILQPWLDRLGGGGPGRLL